jgi:hypothetical protein
VLIYCPDPSNFIHMCQCPSLAREWHAPEVDSFDTTTSPSLRGILFFVHSLRVELIFIVVPSSVGQSFLPSFLSQK